MRLQSAENQKYDTKPCENSGRLSERRDVEQHGGVGVL